MNSSEHSSDKKAGKLTQPFFVNQYLKGEIQSVSLPNGNGILRIDNFVVFVPNTCTGDFVEIKIVEIKKKFALGELVQVIQPSIHRTKPLCPVFDICGGCLLQHVKYDEQLKIKQESISQSFRHLRREKLPIANIIASPRVWNYRNRIQLQIKNSKLGYHKKLTHEFIEIKECLIAETEINRSLANINKVNSDRIEIALDQEQKIHVGPSEKLAKHRLFSQVNEPMNQIIKDWLQKKLNNEKPERFVDLYCGAGNFTFPLYDLFKNSLTQAIGIELSPTSTQQASEFAQLNGYEICFTTGKVEKELNKVPRFTGTELFFLDPPRAGLDPHVVQELLRLRPNKIVYMSCNPSTLARDVGLLVQNSYLIDEIQPFDMFPQTAHVECVAILSIAK